MSTPNIKLRSTVPFKLKDKTDRNWKAVNLLSQFGFLPETILISKPHGMNNTVILSAVLTKEELEKERLLEKSKEIVKAKKITK